MTWRKQVEIKWPGGPGKVLRERSLLRVEGGVSDGPVGRRTCDRRLNARRSRMRLVTRYVMYVTPFPAHAGVVRSVL